MSVDDPEVSVHLLPVPIVQRSDTNPFSIDDLKTSDHEAYIRYNTEYERFKKEMSKAVSKIDRDKQVKKASADVLAAAGKDPETVDKAAARYLELTGDPDAAAYTISRGIKAELQKNTDRFIEEYRFLATQSKQQQDTMDLITTVKDNLFMVKDDLEFSVGTFDKQVSDIQNQINKNKRIHEQAVDYGAWMLFGLNIALVLALLFAIWTLGRKFFKKSSATVAPASGGAPTRKTTKHTASVFRTVERVASG
jgi:DNA segregation ATPase FtsK/SpoIIIE-like protein